jgi:hypothetical protein
MTGIDETSAQNIMDELEEIHAGALTVRELAQRKESAVKAFEWAADRIMAQGANPSRRIAETYSRKPVSRCNHDRATARHR